MIHEIIKKKNYIRPEADATWLENEDLMGTSITASGPDQPSDPEEGFGNAKSIGKIQTSLWDDEDVDIEVEENDDFFSYGW